MKAKFINLVRFFLIFYLRFTSTSVVNAQTNHTDLPYNIDIKNNIRNVKAVNLSSIGKELSYVSLETTPECMIQQISKILFSDSYIFVSDNQKRLLQFDKNGKFIRQIGSQGRGPREYYLVFDFCLDEKKEQIYLISAPQTLLIFGFDGNFKYSYKLSFRPVQIIPKDQNTLMYHCANVPGKNDPSWIITDRHGITTTSIKNNLKRINQPGLIVLNTPLYSFNNTVHFMEFGIDTLYYFKDTLKKPYGIFFLDDLKMDADPLVTESMLKDKKLLNKLMIGSINEYKDFLFIKFFRGMSNAAICAIYNKKTNAVIFLKDDVFINDLDGEAKFWPKQIISDNILVDYVDAFDLLKPKPGALIKKESARLLNLKKQLTATSNPVLMIIK